MPRTVRYPLQEQDSAAMKAVARKLLDCSCDRCVAEYSRMLRSGVGSDAAIRYLNKRGCSEKLEAKAQEPTESNVTVQPPISITVSNTLPTGGVGGVEMAPDLQKAMFSAVPSQSRQTTLGVLPDVIQEADPDVAAASLYDPQYKIQKVAVKGLRHNRIEAIDYSGQKFVYKKRTAPTGAVSWLRFVNEGKPLKSSISEDSEDESSSESDEGNLWD